jgi:transcriptional regulator with XRE-family HTH domain
MDSGITIHKRGYVTISERQGGQKFLSFSTLFEMKVSTVLYAHVSSKNNHPKPPANRLGDLLRHWRNIRGKNQLDLSLETGLSQRHISFIESGRSMPSRQTLMNIAQVLDVPLRDRNVLLLSAGYAPAYSEAAWNSGQMQSVTRALERILRQHEPFPALVMDRYWNVLMTNESTPRFFNCFIKYVATNRAAEYASSYVRSESYAPVC